MDRAGSSARVPDVNGWYEVVDNPLSKVGVFPYHGSTLAGAPDPNRMYNVYRPAEELGNPEFLNSLRLIPFVDDHEMLGAEKDGLTPAEQYGVHGVIGETVKFDGRTVTGNLKVFSQAMASTIEHHKRELSLGYRCEYEWTPGTFEGIRYDAIQRRLRGNHLALVQEGRMGKDVAVLDHQIFTVDSLEYKAMTDEDKGKEGGAELTLEQVEAMLPRLAAFMEKMGALVPGAAGTPPPVEGGDKPGTGGAPAPIAAGAEGAPPPKAEGDDAMKTAAAIDAAAQRTRVVAVADSFKRIADALDTIKNRPPTVAVDASTLARTVAADAADARELVSKLEPHIGVFDSSRMNTADVVAYAVDKLQLKPAKGHERTAVDAYLHGREAPRPHQRMTAADAAASGSSVANFIAGKDKAATA
jgi:hypothetical protein